MVISAHVTMQISTVSRMRHPTVLRGRPWTRAEPIAGARKYLLCCIRQVAAKD